MEREKKKEEKRILEITSLIVPKAFNYDQAIETKRVYYIEII